MGKGTRVIIGTLARYFGSCIAVDPKGENAAITARQRACFTDVHIINPWGELAGTFQKLGFTSAIYNPLDILDRDDPNAVAIAQALAAAICPKEGKGKDSYWSDAAASLLTGVRGRYATHLAEAAYHGGNAYLQARPDEQKGPPPLHVSH